MKALVSKLNGIGFEPTLESAKDWRREVWTSIGSVALFVKDRGFKSPVKPCMLLSDSVRQEVFPQAQEKESTSTPYDAVIVGLASSLFDYAHLNTAFRILQGEEDRSGRSVPLIATHKAKSIERDDPPGLSLGPGPFVTALEDATGCQSHVVGKPTKTFFELFINNSSASEHAQEEGKIAAIGDDVEADLGDGAVELGLWRVLVKTGKYRAGDEVRPGIVPPDEVYENFAAFVDHLLSSNAQKHDSNADAETLIIGKAQIQRKKSDIKSLRLDAPYAVLRHDANSG
ncbi:hypothetical protein NMY22_g4367 [Coprinellus aureogranulatus]|nr:hypothetical protein NMY22_g4367 [Coprinellus aureogranulatus]